jgi:hypothetical protein
MSAFFLAIALCLSYGFGPFSLTGNIKGKVVDFYTQQPINGAIVTANNEVVQTDEKGTFFLKTEADKVAVRACGYLRAEQAVASPVLPLFTAPLSIKLVPLRPKALYLSFYGIGSRKLRDSALKLIEDTELNALVIDVKGDRGMIPYRSSVPLASSVGAQEITLIKDMKGLVKSLKDKGVYTIARIVVFKDDLLAVARPDLAVKTGNGAIWRDREKLAWVDPSKKEVWDYNISIAVEAAQIGFDEIQFDYVRFPDKPGLIFSMQNTEENRVGAIASFLKEARRKLMPYNVFLAADVFGYVSWNLNDTMIGQKLESLSPVLDYLSPMLYPSGFHFGIPGYRIPVAHPYEIVSLTLKRGRERTRLPAVRFRPWIQAFRDYSFDKRHFTGKEIRAQIDAAEEFGSDGWMLWNPHNVYTAEGLKERKR